MASGLYGLSLFKMEGVSSCMRDGGVKTRWASFALAHEEGEDSLVVIAGENVLVAQVQSTVLRL